MDIEITVSADTGHEITLEDIGKAVRVSEHWCQLRDWVRSRTRLGLHVQFYLASVAAEDADMAGLLERVATQVLQGLGSPRGQRRDRAPGVVFWQIIGSKRVAQQRRVVLRIVPL